MKKNNVGAIILLMMCMSINGALAPYIPSYDDRYEEDISQAEGNKDCFIEPADGINYANYHYLGAHAAEKYPRFFPEYSLQAQTIPGMLYAGVRGLMLSTYNWSFGWSSIVKEGISVICSHPKKEEAIVFRKNGKPLFQTLHYEMNRIFNFLKSHPKAVITIIFDDYADINKINRDMKEIVMKNDYDPILKPSDWPTVQQKGEWPTLGWMRKNNKRLILFTQIYDNHTNFTWPLKRYFWENVYGTIDENLICVEEKYSVLEDDKHNRRLVSFGCFGSVATVSPGARNPLRCLDYDTVKRLTTGCQKKGFAQGKLINCYWVDHVIEGLDILRTEGRKTACEYINELNAIRQ